MNHQWKLVLWMTSLQAMSEMQRHAKVPVSETCNDHLQLSTENSHMTQTTIKLNKREKRVFLENKPFIHVYYCIVNAFSITVNPYKI